MLGWLGSNVRGRLPRRSLCTEHNVRDVCRGGEGNAAGNSGSSHCLPSQVTMPSHSSSVIQRQTSQAVKWQATKAPITTGSALPARRRKASEGNGGAAGNTVRAQES